MSSKLIVPVIVGLLAKYVLGDWDEGYVWSVQDLLYWGMVISVSYTTIWTWEIYWKLTSI